MTLGLTKNMPAEPTNEVVIPPGWAAEFVGKADLELSFVALTGHQHFYAEALRGRLRSLALRFKDAQTHFQAAEALAKGALRSIPNLIRKFMLSVYTFECNLLEAPLDLRTAPPEYWIPDIPKKLYEEYPEVRLVVNLKKAVEAVLKLHRGEHDRAEELYQELVEENREGPKDIVAPFFLGLAAAQHNLGLIDAARRNRENAGLSIQFGGNVLNRALTAGQLVGFCSYLEAPEEADGWRKFLWSLNCPEATKSAFLKRGTLLFERSLALEQLIVL